jgi:nitrite reductase/ring-hydroxylating ferredoxin subunit
VGWHQVIQKAEVRQGLVTEVVVGDRTIALFNLDDVIFATDNLCTHAPACLAEGFVEGDLIECPRHMGSFHIPTGKPVHEPAIVPLQTYKVRQQGDAVFVEIPE